MVINCLKTAGSPATKIFENRIANQPRYITTAAFARFTTVSKDGARAWQKVRIITPKKFGRSVR